MSNEVSFCFFKNICNPFLLFFLCNGEGGGSDESSDDSYTDETDIYIYIYKITF